MTTKVVPRVMRYNRNVRVGYHSQSFIFSSIEFLELWFFLWISLLPKRCEKHVSFFP